MHPLRGLYAITSQAICSDSARLLAAAEDALAGGAALLQYRDKWSDAAVRARNARALLGLCRVHGALFIVNDDVELALACGADGVHVGASDEPLATARARLGPEAVIGVSCSGSLERALAAQAGGASYVAFGRFFDSRTKPDAPPAPPELLSLARPQLRIPVCAIGGVTPDNAPTLIARGADMVAAVEGVFGAPDIEAAARAYAQLFRC
ncbi:MAG: thiamine phosphate synthase [Nevskiaceae bacterium]|nr:MAG: thiamine phosphate synthase [Nevskiaceae bacterium]